MFEIAPVSLLDGLYMSHIVMYSKLAEVHAKNSRLRNENVEIFVRFCA